MESQGDDSPRFFQNCKPPAPPGPEDLWELQFCRWWGWNWVRKKDDCQRQRVTTECTRPNQPSAKEKTSRFQNLFKRLRNKIQISQSRSILTEYYTRARIPGKRREKYGTTISNKKNVPCKDMYGYLDKKVTDRQCCSTSALEGSGSSSSAYCFNQRQKNYRFRAEGNEYLKAQYYPHRSQKNKEPFEVNCCSTQTCENQCNSMMKPAKDKREHRYKKHVCFVCCPCSHKCGLCPYVQECISVDRVENIEKRKQPEVGTQWSEQVHETEKSTTKTQNITPAERENDNCITTNQKHKITEKPELPVKDKTNTGTSPMHSFYDPHDLSRRPKEKIYETKKLPKCIFDSKNYPWLQTSRPHISPDICRFRIEDEFFSPISGKSYNLLPLKLQNSTIQLTDYPDPIGVEDDVQYLRKLESDAKMDRASHVMLDAVFDAVLVKDNFIDDVGWCLNNLKGLGGDKRIDDLLNTMDAKYSSCSNDSSQEILNEFSQYRSSKFPQFKHSSGNCRRRKKHHKMEGLYGNVDDTTNSTDTSSKSTKTNDLLEKLLENRWRNTNDDYMKKSEENNFGSRESALERDAFKKCKEKRPTQSNLAKVGTGGQTGKNKSPFIYKDSDAGMPQRKYIKPTKRSASSIPAMPLSKRKKSNDSMDIRNVFCQPFENFESQFKKRGNEGTEIRNNLATSSFHGIKSAQYGIMANHVNQSKDERHPLLSRLANRKMEQMALSGSTGIFSTFTQSKLWEPRETKEDLGAIMSNVKDIFSKIDQMVLRRYASDQEMKNLLHAIPSRSCQYKIAPHQSFNEESYLTINNPSSELDTITNITCNLTSFPDLREHHEPEERADEEKLIPTNVEQVLEDKKENKVRHSMIPVRKKRTKTNPS